MDSRKSATLVKYNEARAALAHCVRVDEAKSIRDKAEAMRAYAIQVNDTELEMWAAEIKVRSQRRIGELSRDLEKAKVDGPTGKFRIPPGGNRKSDALRNAGLSPQAAHRCEVIASIPESTFEAIIDEKKKRREPVSSKQILKAVVRAQRTERIKKSRKSFGGCTVDDLAGLVVANKKFSCIYADPPWQYGNQASRGAADNHYSTMTVDDIAALPVSKLAAKQCHLHLWTTNGFLRESLVILEGWGFEFKSTFVWVKPQLGVGNYWRCTHEIMLLGVKGGLVFPPTSIPSWLNAERTEHSAKPEKVRELIEAVSPGPRLELFGRRLAKGWVVFGNEVERETFKKQAEMVG